MLWWPAALWARYPYERFDLILSGIPSLVEQFRSQGIQAAYLAHAFDRRILQRVPVATERIPRVAFVGSLTSDHADRITFLDALARRVDVDFYGRGVEYLPADSPLRKRYRGPAWGDDLYSIYGSYLVVFHKIIGVVGTSASAKRLFEATGMGACVMAEASDDMPGLFQPEHEIVTYATFDECVEKITDLLAHPEIALQIGQRAQQRTLAEHTYARRVQQILQYTKQFGF
jgi:spore maturation protein CgeB